jgi:hypothetical protein
MKAKILFHCLVLLLVPGANAQLALVNSTTSGDGLYTYTFSRNPAQSLVWGWLTGGVIGSGFIVQSSGVLDVFSPQGWDSSVDPSGLVQWFPIVAPTYLDGTLTFGIRSSIFDSMIFHGNLSDQLGVIAGAAYTYPDHAYYAGGYQTFDYVGPVAVPEHATSSLLAIGLGIVLIASRIRRTNRPAGY